MKSGRGPVASAAEQVKGKIDARRVAAAVVVVAAAEDDRPGAGGDVTMYRPAGPARPDHRHRPKEAPSHIARARACLLS